MGFYIKNIDIVNMCHSKHARDIILHEVKKYDNTTYWYITKRKYWVLYSKKEKIPIVVVDSICVGCYSENSKFIYFFILNEVKQLMRLHKIRKLIK
jgi:hypothetical protein